MLRRVDGAAMLPPLLGGAFLWSAHLKEPGCVVGEHMHVRRRVDDDGAKGILTICRSREETERDRPGEVGRSMRDNRKEVEEADFEGEDIPARWTRVGDVER